jgi:protein TonB
LQRVKFILQNRLFSFALAVSMLVHAVLLAIRFVPPEAFRFSPTDPGLEVILVNAKHDRAPLKAEALAQANLDGGGNAEEGRAKSPLPDTRRVQDGESLRETRQRVAELEAMQQRMLAQARSETTAAVRPATDKPKPRNAPVEPDGTDKEEQARVLARMEAEIAKEIENYNKRPKKTQISPSTKEVGYAVYYNALQKRIEHVGTLNFPEHKGKKLYGELIVYIPIFHDGSIYEKEGGPRIERSSGNPNLDRAAVRIVRNAAPFGRIPAKMRTVGKDDVWEIVTRFKFTHEKGLETEMRGGV